ncbi:MAG: hypothetical protein KBT35_05245 [Firmicutes bacterium]|nr:hypothetical protein [Candidatus Colivicinus equi]
MESKKRRKKLSTSALVLLISLIVIAIPCLIFAGILITSALETNKPVIGSRFDNDLEIQISSSDANDVKDAISLISGVESVEVDGITTGQLVVLIDISDSATEDEAKDIATQAYEKTIGILPVKTYFSSSDTNKNYDLAIHVYNRLSADDDYDTWSYVIYTKNAMMSLPEMQVVSTAIDENLAKELRGELESVEIQIDETAGTSEETGD